MGIPPAERGVVAIVDDERGIDRGTARADKTLDHSRGGPDLAALADRLTLILETLEGGVLGLASSETTVLLLIYWLEREQLTKSEAVDVLNRLKRTDQLAVFIGLATRDSRLRAWLGDRGVPWAFIQQHWQPSATDSANFFIGYVAGAGEAAIEGLILLARLVTSPLVPLLAQAASGLRVLDEATARRLIEERDEFQRGLHDAFAQLFASPVATLERGLVDLHHRYQKHLWNFEFFEAGRLAGGVIWTLLSLHAVARSLAGLANVVATVTALTVKKLFELISRSGLERFLAQLAPRPAMVLPGAGGRSVVVVQAGERLVVLDGAQGKALGHIHINEAVQALAASGNAASAIDDLSDEFTGAADDAAPRGQRRPPIVGGGGGLPSEPRLLAPKAPLDATVEFLERHLDYLRALPKDITPKQLENLIERLKKPTLGTLQYYVTLVEQLLKRDYIAQLNRVLPFEVVSVQRIPSRGAGRGARAASGGEMEIIERTLRDGGETRLTWTARSKNGTLVQIDDFDAARGVPREIKSARELAEAGDDVDGALARVERDYAERLQRHAQFASEQNIPFFEWVVFNKTMERALEGLLSRQPRAVRERIRLVLNPYFE